MGYVPFETENAIYRLELKLHISSPQEFKHAGADAFVLEWEGEPTYLPIMRLYNTVFDFAARNNKELWFPDVGIRPISTLRSLVKEALIFVPSTLLATKAFRKFKKMKSQKLSRRDFIKRAGTGGALSATALASNPLFWNSLLSYGGEIKKREPLRKFEEILRRWPLTAVAEGRNAINAEKIERFIAPKLRARLGRKPVIYACFGPGHAGLKEMLQNPKKREQVLKAFNPPEAFFYQENLRGCVLHKFDPKTKKWGQSVFENVMKFPKPQAKKQQNAEPKQRLMAKLTREKKLSRRQFLRRMVRA